MKKLCLAATALGGLIAAPALADSLAPSTYSTTIGVGGTATLNKTITVSAGGAGVGQADVLFIIDTTGSMGTAISSVQSSLVGLVSAISGNVGFGVAEYKDIGDPFIYNLVQPITTNTSLVQTGLNGLSASGGGDTPEQGLYALQQGALAGSGWRAGSKKIEVIVGDAPAHETVAQPPAPSGVSVAAAASDLSAAGINVQSIDVGDLNGFGQFSGAGSIYAAGATGDYSLSDYAAAAEAINDAIEAAFQTYNLIELQVVGAPAGVTVDTCVPIAGSFDRSIERSFDCTVTFTGVAPGTYDFSINALVDGGIIASEADHIVVTGDVATPEPASLALLGAGLLGLGLTRRRLGLLQNR